MSDTYLEGYEQWKKKLLEELPEASPPPPPEQQPCYVHRKVEYVGFTDRFDYCEICGRKYKDGAWVK